MAEPKVSWSILSTIGIWVVSALLAWGVVQARVAVLEDRVEILIDDVWEMRADIKLLLRRDPR